MHREESLLIERFQARQKVRQTTSLFQAWHVGTILSKVEKDEAEVTPPPPSPRFLHTLSLILLSVSL